MQPAKQELEQLKLQGQLIRKFNDDQSWQRVLGVDNSYQGTVTTGGGNIPLSNTVNYCSTPMHAVSYSASDLRLNE